MRFLCLLKKAVHPALLAFALILFRSGAVQAEFVQGVPPLAEALAEADVIVSGVLRSVVPPDWNSPNAFVYRFTFEPQIVLRGQPGAAMALTGFEKRGFIWPRDLAPFEPGTRCILLIKSDAARTLVAVLPALLTPPTNGETSTLKPLFIEAVFQRLMKPRDPSSGDGLSLNVVGNELSVSQLETLRSTHPESAVEIDEILDRRLDAEILRLADAGAFEEAEKMIPGIRSEELRSQGVARLVNAHNYRGEYDAALALIPRLSPHDRVVFLEAIARSLERTRPADAKAAVEAMLKAFEETPAGGLRYNGLAGIVASYLSRHGREEEARVLLSKGVELAPAYAATLAADQIRLGFIADALVSIGRLDSFNQIIRLAREAEALARSGQKEAANDFLARARTVALSVDKSNRARYVDEIEKAQTLVNSAR